MLMASLPYWPINPSISSDVWFNFQLDFVRCLWVVLPGAILWGASFPLALAAVAAPRSGSGPAGRRRLCGEHRRRDRRLGRERPRAGDDGSARQTSQQILIVLSAISALLLLAPAAAGEGRTVGDGAGAPTVLLVVATGWRRPARAKRAAICRSILVAYGRYAATWVGSEQHHLRGRGAERVGRRVRDCRTACRTTTTPAKCRRRASRRTCACSACSATSRTLIPKSPECGARHRVRRRRHGRRGQHRSERRDDDDRRDRAARAARRSSTLLRRAQLSTSSGNPKIARPASTMRGTSC